MFFKTFNSNSKCHSELRSARRLFSHFVLPHSVLVLLSQRTKFPPEVNIDLEVEVALVASVRPHSENAENFFALLAGDVVLQVEDRLLPVGVGSLRRGGEANALVAFGELNVEEGHKGLQKNKIVVTGVNVTIAVPALFGRNHRRIFFHCKYFISVIEPT